MSRTAMAVMDSDGSNVQHGGGRDRAIVLAALIAVAAGVYWLGHSATKGDAGGSLVAQTAPSLSLESAGEARLPLASDESSAKDRRGELQLVPLAAPSVEIPALHVTELRLHGRVVDDRTDRPLAGAAIEFAAHRENAPTLAAHALSADDGSFEFTAIEDAALQPADPHAVDAFVPTFTVRREGHAPLRCPPWKHGSLDRHLLDGTPYAFGDIRLTRGAVLTGRVVGDVDGQGIAGAVLLLCEDRDGNTSAPFAIGRTDTRGMMLIDDRVPSLRSDTNWLLVTVSPRGMGWRRVVLLDGRERIDDIEVRVLAPAPLRVDVVDMDGNPIEGAVVRAEPRFAPLRGLVGSSYDSIPNRCEPLSSFLSATSDASGRVLFDALPLPPPTWKDDPRSGLYNLVAEHVGFVRTWLATDWEKGVVLQRQGAEHPVKIVMPRMQARTVSGRVMDTDRNGIPTAQIALVGGRSFACDADGRFEIHGLNPSQPRIDLLASAPGFVGAAKLVTLSATQEPSAVEFELERPVPIEGRVVDEHGAPWNGAIVWARRDDRQTTHTRTRVDGHFSLTDTRAGRWRLTSSPSAERNSRHFEASVDATGGDRSVEILLPRSTGATLRATVIDAETGDLLDPMNVSLLSNRKGDGKGWDVDRTSGSISADHLPAGDWRLWVSVPGRATAFADFVVSEGDLEVRVEVKAGEATGAIALRLVFDEAMNADDWDVEGHLNSPRGYLPWWGTSRCRLESGRRDVDGVRHFDRLTPGPWTLTLVGRSIHNEVDVDVAPGRETAVEMAARPSATLHFVADVDADDVMMRVDVVRADGTSEPQFSGSKAEYGRCTHDVPVEAGTYRWTAHFERKGESGHRIEIADSRSGELSVGHGELRRVDVPFARK